MRLPKILFALAALATLLVVVPDRARAEGWFSEIGDPVEVTIGDLLADPGEYEGSEIRLKAVYRGEGSTWNPYYTQFSRATHGNFEAWPWNARVYEKRDFLTAYPFFYVDKQGDERRLWRKVQGLDTFQGIEISGVVRTVWRGKPFIEVTDVDTISGALDADEVRDVVAGDAYFAAGEYAKAEEAYDDALSSRHAPWLRAELYRKLGDARFMQRDYRGARNSYEDALDEAEDSDVLRRAYDAAETRYQAQRNDQPIGANAPRPPARSVPTTGDGTNDVDAILASFEASPTRDEAAMPAEEVLETPIEPEPTPAEEVVVEEPTEPEEIVVEESPEGMTEEVVEPEEPVEPAEPIEVPEEMPEEDAEGMVDEADEPAMPDEPAEEIAEEMAEDEPTEGITEEMPEEAPEEIVEEAAEEMTEEVDEPAEPTVPEEIAEDVAAAEDEAGVAEEMPEEAPEEIVEEATEEMAEAVDEPAMPEETEVAPVPVEADAAETVEIGDLPMLPFFGCEQVTEEQFRALLIEIRNNPETFDE